MEEQIMNVNEECMEEAVLATERSSGLSTGLAMLIGSAITVAAIAGGKKLKKVWNEHKAKKDKPDVVDCEFEEIFEEESENTEKSEN